ARQISSPSCSTPKPMVPAPTNGAKKGNTFFRT
ncbi:virulence factor, partial [Salmonella enterica subsp. salamae]|nr:virulence factor [Salmonella enterica subsp. salamae]